MNERAALSGRFLEDFQIGDIYRSQVGRTISEADNVWFTLLTNNSNQMHFNKVFAARTEFGRPLVVSTLTLAIVLGLSVADTSQNAIANLGWREIRLPAPVFAGDTLWAETGVLSSRESRSRRGFGIVAVRTRGLNQDAKTVVEFERSFMIPNRSAADHLDSFPTSSEPWTLGKVDA